MVKNKRPKVAFLEILSCGAQMQTIVAAKSTTERNPLMKVIIIFMALVLNC